MTHWLTTLLTQSLELSHSQAPTSSAATQKLPSILWNAKAHKSSPVVHARSDTLQPTSGISTLILSTNLLLCLASGLFPFRFAHQWPVCISLLHEINQNNADSNFSSYLKGWSFSWGVWPETTVPWRIRTLSVWREPCGALVSRTHYAWFPIAAGWRVCEMLKPEFAASKHTHTLTHISLSLSLT